jgi:GYF domain 2
MSDNPEQTQLSPAVQSPALQSAALQSAALQSPALQPADLPLQPYSDADEVATRYFETPRPPALWIVQVSMFERPSMTREQLLDELQNGLVQSDTLVWRAGMRDWSAVAQVEDLRRALPLHLVPGESPRRTSSVAWLCGAAALLTVSVALYVLSAAGVFDTGARADRARPSAAAALGVP